MQPLPVKTQTIKSVSNTHKNLRMPQLNPLFQINTEKRVSPKITIDLNPDINSDIDSSDDETPKACRRQVKPPLVTAGKSLQAVPPNLQKVKEDGRAMQTTESSAHSNNAQPAMEKLQFVECINSPIKPHIKRSQSVIDNSIKHSTHHNIYQPIESGIKELFHKNLNTEYSSHKSISLIKKIQSTKISTQNKQIINISWFLGGKLSNNIKSEYLNNLKELIVQNVNIDFAILLDHSTFLKNQKYFIEIMNYKNFNFRFVEDITFKDKHLQDLHKAHMAHAIAGNPASASDFYRLVIPTLLDEKYEISYYTDFDDMRNLDKEYLNIANKDNIWCKAKQVLDNTESAICTGPQGNSRIFFDLSKEGRIKLKNQLIHLHSSMTNYNLLPANINYPFPDVATALFHGGSLIHAVKPADASNIFNHKSAETDNTWVDSYKLSPIKVKEFEQFINKQNVKENEYVIDIGKILAKLNAQSQRIKQTVNNRKLTIVTRPLLTEEINSILSNINYILRALAKCNNHNNNYNALKLIFGKIILNLEKKQTTDLEFVKTIEQLKEQIAISEFKIDDNSSDDSDFEPYDI